MVHFSTNLFHLSDKFVSDLLLFLSPALAVVKRVPFPEVLTVNFSGVWLQMVDFVIGELGEVRPSENRVCTLKVFRDVEQVGIDPLWLLTDGPELHDDVVGAIEEDGVEVCNCTGEACGKDECDDLAGMCDGMKFFCRRLSHAMCVLDAWENSRVKCVLPTDTVTGGQGSSAEWAIE